ncbi:tetratricopeptide repeat protein [Aquabacterium sp. CECT 9606]|uniref:tetratricopeptide repeat protein n=1 Tax=Aquabacterium sp. CECT 9606 TaxID=2845822 RepID=UPI001E3044D9|nr:tetratricopeptide repeat protein [Aquabacterium sp. CECT 9606]CAH0347820.1 Chaperedoxin [Aquabacterium sp. CECT 9606]
MIDITLENFETDLLAGSTQQPILLDIWAPWCGPCKALGPVLEKLEVDYAGRFQLAKLNADEQQEIAGQLSQMFGVRSIPFCVMFVGGQPVDGFVGALPEAQIREFLDKHVPSEGALTSEAETVQAEQLVAEGDTASALDLLEDAVARDPGNDEARYDLIKLLLAQGNPAAAASVFEPIGARATGLLAEPRVTAFGRYINAAQTAPDLRPASVLTDAIAANKRDFAARFELAQQHFAVGLFTQAMDELLEIIMRDKTWSDELARKTYVAILEVMTKPIPKAPAKQAAAAPTDTKGKLEIAGKHEVASADPVIDQYRRKLSMALF